MRCSLMLFPAVLLQDMGDTTSVSLLNLDPSEHTPEVNPVSFLTFLLKIFHLDW